MSYLLQRYRHFLVSFIFFKNRTFNALAVLCCNMSCDRNTVLVSEKLIVLSQEDS